MAVGHLRPPPQLFSEIIGISLASLSAIENGLPVVARRELQDEDAAELDVVELGQQAVRVDLSIAWGRGSSPSPLLSLAWTSAAVGTGRLTRSGMPHHLSAIGRTSPPRRALYASR